MQTTLAAFAYLCVLFISQVFREIINDWSIDFDGMHANFFLLPGIVYVWSMVLAYADTEHAISVFLSVSLPVTHRQKTRLNVSLNSLLLYTYSLPKCTA